MIEFMKIKLKLLLKRLAINNNNNLHEKIFNKLIRDIKSEDLSFIEFKTELNSEEFKQLTESSSLRNFIKDFSSLLELINSLNRNLNIEKVLIIKVLNKILHDMTSSDCANLISEEKFSEIFKQIENWKQNFYANQFVDIFNSLKITDEDGLYDRLVDAINKNGLIGLTEFEEEIDSRKKFKILFSAVENFLEESQHNSEAQPSKKTTIKDNETKFQIQNKPERHIEHGKLIQPVKTIQINDLIKLKKRISPMPISLEKNILNLIIHSSFKQLEPQTLIIHGIEISSLDEIIATELSSSKERLNLEHSGNQDFKACLDSFSNKINIQDWSTAVKELNKFLKKIRPLDIHELIFLIQKAKEAASLIENQDVVLLFGETGSGKSTTIQFLAGCKMIEQKVEIQSGEIIEHITAQEPITNPALRTVISSYKAKSETRFINPITIHLKDIGAKYDKRSIIICDTPGSGDTAGPEVDIANGIGIIEAVKGCKSVRPVVLSSYLKLGDRGEGIRYLAHWLVDMVKDIDQHLSAFSYLFTKYPPGKDIHAILLNIKNTLDEEDSEESQDESFNKLLIDILEKCEHSKSLNPIKPSDPEKANTFEEPLKFVKKFLNTNSISNPEKVFSMPIKENSRNALNEQLRMHQLCIISAVARGEYLLIHQKLQELKFLSENLSDKLTIQIFKDCMNLVSDTVCKKHDEIVIQFNGILENQNKIQIYDVSSYKEHSLEFQKLECLKSFDSLKSISGLSEALIQNIKIKLTELNYQLKEMDLKKKETKINLDNMKLIVSKFPEIEPSYIDITAYLLNKLKNLATEAKTEVKTNNFEKVSELIQSIHKATTNLKEHLDLNETEKLVKNLADSTILHLKSISKLIDVILRKDKSLDDKNIINLSGYLKILEDAKDKLTSNINIQKEIIIEIHKEALLKLDNYFDGLNKKVTDLFDKPEKPFKKIECLVKEMQCMRLIPGIETLTSERYHFTLQSIIGCMQNIQREAESLLKDFQNDKENRNYEKIFNFLKCLKNAEWIDGYKQGTYEEVIKNIKNELINNSSLIQEEICELDLNISDCKNFEKCFKLLRKLEKMEKFEFTFPELENYRKISSDKFYNAVNSHFNKIKTTYSLSNQHVDPKNVDLNETNAVENFKQSFESLQLSKQIRTRKVLEQLSNQAGKESTNFNTDASLEKTQTIESTSRQIFNRLNLTDAENVYAFLKTCKNINTIKGDASILSNEFENYIKNYREHIDIEINIYFDQIESLRSEEVKFAFRLAQNMKFYMQELREMSMLNSTSGLKSLKELLNSTEISQNITERLSNYLITLTDQLHDQTVDKVYLKNKLVIVKALSQLDLFLENKYFLLYRRYQEEVKREFKDFYVKIINHIEKYEYKNVNAELMEIEDYPVNENAFNQIKFLLASSINELVDLTITLAITLSNTLEPESIKTIVENLKKLESAKTYISNTNFDENSQSKFKSDGYIDTHTRERLNNGVKEIQQIVSKKIIIYLDNIEALISLNHFYEAEEKRNHLNTVRHLLGNYCLITETTEKYEEIEKKLVGIVDTVTENFERMSFKDYIQNTPKVIIERLENVSKMNLKYSLALTKIKSVLNNKIETVLSEAKNANTGKRREHLLLIESVKWSLPTETKGYLEAEVENIKNYVNQKEVEYEQDLKKLISSSDMNAVFDFMERCCKDGMYRVLRIAQEDTLKEIMALKEKLVGALEEDNIEIAFELFKKFINYKKILSKKITEIEGYFSDVKKQLINKLSRIASVLNEISQEENCEIMVQHFKYFKLFFEFKSEIESNDENTKKFDDLEDIFSKLTAKLETAFVKVLEFFTVFQSKYEIAVTEYNILILNESMNAMKKWDPLFILLKKSSSIYETHLKIEVGIKIEKSKTYSQMVTEVATMLKKFRTEILSFELSRAYDKERDHLYRLLTRKIFTIMNAKDLKTHLDKNFFDITCYEKEIFPFLVNKFEKVSQNAKTIFENNFSKKDFDAFRLNYDNLITFEKYSKPFSMDLQRHIEEINEKLYKKLTSLEVLVANPESSIETIASTIIDMKAFADNLPNFNEHINERIDNILKNYSNQFKEERGVALNKLSIALEQDPTGVGLSIISEHKIFKGQAISLFNQETQRHDINHILSNIDGNSICYELLRDNYENFNSLYKSIVKEYLNKLQKSKDKDSTLTELVRRIKLLPDKLKNKTSFKKWDACDRRIITNLMSHIFALWTLSNTDYFNEMKGVENRDTFLLSPHPGQVISIFRLLGIGYMDNNVSYIKKSTILDGLQNNLVQVGTGEGKSLILAASSCILVLIGMEVSCACYSEYLSSRDYESFSAIFNSLGVEQSIHYGTFNKICENVINEKGDIRNRVINLIFSSASSIVPMADVELRRKSKEEREKILLIDEVDVFFNQDFYGNIYTPLARLNDITINNLTDYIWRNRNLRLNIKTLEATAEYKACCERFSGWEFLIKEATKDMLADVNNYQHDYIIKNDKLAYKEQDGISYDVVYGYKTMFAYYHENQQGKISDASLKENISIGIKCGSFSYAEIPNCFQFIMGVTGTLHTLSKSERNIVEDVYKIRKNTYIPSVFGANKRMFAREADVLIENKDDYFQVLKEKLENALVSVNKKISALL